MQSAPLNFLDRARRWLKVRGPFEHLKAPFNIPHPVP
jgi:hypothetical protein